MLIHHEVIEREKQTKKTIYNKHQIYNQYARLASSRLYRVARKNVPNFRMALCNRVDEMNQQKSIM